MSQQGWREAGNTDALWREGPAREWASPRQIRLWACACARRLWELLPDERSRRAVEVMELYADGLATEQERSSADNAAGAASLQFDITGDAADRAHLWAAQAVEWVIGGDLPADPDEVSYLAALAFRDLARFQNPTEEFDLGAGEYAGGPASEAAETAADLAHANLLREVIGNPFRPAKVKPAWLTSDVLALARGIYDEKAFDRMPILADALQDAGCDNPDVLNHCCDATGPHVCGCWVIDALLGKT